MKKHQYGVPQGSVLGPELFNLVVHEICDLCSIRHFLMSADDRKKKNVLESAVSTKTNYPSTGTKLS